jgi:hypothetical protein
MEDRKMNKWIRVNHAYELPVTSDIRIRINGHFSGPLGDYTKTDALRVLGDTDPNGRPYSIVEYMLAQD